MPDSSIMLELCEISGSTVNELLSGEEIDMTKNVIISILFSATLLIGIMVCLICNLAISGSLTWALIPVSSIVFVWIISFPSILWGKRGMVVSLISISVFIVPYLFLLSRFIKVKEVFSVGSAMAVASIVFLWINVAVFNRFGTSRKLVALGTTFLLAIPFVFIVNVLLSNMIADPILDVWDILAFFLLLIFAFVAFICDYVKKKGLMK